MDDRERSYLTRDERRAQLLGVGLRLFSTRPHDEVSIDDIASEAGVSKGLLYHYFGGKTELYVAVVELAAAQLLASLLPDPSRSGVDNTRAGLAAYFDFVQARGDAFLALMGGGPGADPAVQKVLERTREAIVAQLLHTAQIDGNNPAFRVAARSWLGAVETASVDWLRHGDVGREALVDLLCASLFTHLLVAARQAPQAVRGDLLQGLPLLRGLLG